MASDLENLSARRSAIIQELADISTASAGGLPNSGAGIDHQGYKRSLYDELREINQMIQSLDGDFEIASQGFAG